MPSILNLKFKGNKSFVAFSNLGDTESLTQTWKVCTKVASYLEQGQRLENLSWRLWHLQNLIVDTDNAKSRREFKKLSKCMGDKLDKEKGRSIAELPAPDFKRNHSTDMIKQRAAEKERNREANLYGGTIKRMQFTFSVDQLAQPLTSTPVKKPDMKPSAELSKRCRAPVVRVHHENTAMTDPDASSVNFTTSDSASVISAPTPLAPSQALHFPTLFNDSFTPSALLYASPTLTTTLTYGEGLMSSSSDDQFRISRPTIEVPLDEILFNDDCSDSSWASAINVLSGANTTIDIAPSQSSDEDLNEDLDHSFEKAPEVASASTAENIVPVSAAGQHYQEDVIMLPVEPAHISDHPILQQPISLTPPLPVEQQYSTIPDLSNTLNIHRALSISGSSSSGADDEAASNRDFSDDEDDIDIDDRSPAPSTAKRTSIFKNLAPVSNSANAETVAPSRLHSIYGARSSTPNTSRPTLTLKTQGTMTTRSSGPGATLTNLNPSILRSNNLNGPGGIKAECSNCGATQTPLWRRGLNDELNCNACGLYCKLHKRPRPKSMRSTQGESRAPPTPRPEVVEIVPSRPRSLSTKGPQLSDNPPPRQSVSAQCYNCHTTATPLWRKDDEGKTVCNACGLYYKLHGSARPISMKSDVIRKRSRHDARRSSQSGLEDFPPSPGISHTSPVRDTSPTLAPDSTTQMSYDFGEEMSEFRCNTSSSELVGALGNPASTANNSNAGSGTNHASNDSNGLYSSFPVAYNGSYHPDYLMQLYGLQSDPLPFSGVESTVESDPNMSPRSSKRRRMSTDSASEPPSSAAPFGGSVTSSNGGDGYTSASSVSSHHSRKGSMDFPFPTYNSNGTLNQGPALRGPGNTFWHPPMMPQPHSDSETFWHPSPVPPTKNNASNRSKKIAKDYSPTSDNTSESSGSSVRSCSNPPSKTEDSTMDFLHALHDDELFSAYLHPHDEKTVSHVEVGNAMYVDSFFHR